MGENVREYSDENKNSDNWRDKLKRKVIEDSSELTKKSTRPRETNTLENGSLHTKSHTCKNREYSLKEDNSIILKC